MICLSSREGVGVARLHREGEAILGGLGGDGLAVFLYSQGVSEISTVPSWEEDKLAVVRAPLSQSMSTV